MRIYITIIMLGIIGGISYAADYPSCKLGGCIAGQFVYDQTETVAYHSDLIFNQARFSLTANLSEKVNGLVLIESKTGSPVLQNAYINVLPLGNAEIRFGYIKLPFGIEGYGNALQYPTISSSKASKNIYRGAHDMGIHLSYSLKAIKGIIAAVNGNSSSPKDNNDFKDQAGKLILTPISNLALEGSFYNGKSDTADLSTQRYAGGMDYQKNPVWVRAEFLGAKDETIKSMGWYAAAAYRFLPVVEAAFRYEDYDPNTDIQNDKYTNYTIGLNYYLFAKGWDRISVNYELRSDDADPDLKGLFTAQLQILF